MRVKNFSNFLFEYENPNQVSYPSRFFSDITGIRVYQDWEIPGSDMDIQKELISLNRVGRNDDISLIYPIEEMWKKFVELNPQIFSWIVPSSKINEAVQKWDIMFGMVSKYNENDIRSFLTRKGTNVSPKERERIDEIEEKTGVLITWIPSLKTMEYIEDNL